MDNNEIGKVLDAINNLYSKIDKLVEEKKHSSYESEQTNELNCALSKAHSEYPSITTNKTNPYWGNKYADFDCIMLLIRPILAKYGLELTQRTILTEDGSSYLQTRLWHSSGQWIESRIKVIPSKNDNHTYLSARQELKKSEAMDLLNITISEDPYDDDGEMQQAGARAIFAKGIELNANYSPKKESRDVISKEQLEELEYELQEHADIAEEVMNNLKIRSLADMPKSRYLTSLTRIREIKKLRNENNVK